MNTISRALISCTDKSHLVTLGRFLAERGVEILSTGGTAKLLKDHDITVTEVSEYTGFSEILGGRLKTLHPKIHGGILSVRDDEQHQREIKEHGIEPIDLIVVNLYAFEKTVADPECSLEQAIENIDIGGPSMLRAAAKNYGDVIVVVDPADYNELMDRIVKDDVTEEYRLSLALKAFKRTADYDSAISEFLKTKVSFETTRDKFPKEFVQNFVKVQDLRYGENPHQQAALYRSQATVGGVVSAKQLQGKELSFNNYLDLDSAFQCCHEFSEPACVIVKHLNPCGVAVAHQLPEAFVKARACDPVSAFGGIVAFNKPVHKDLAAMISETFFEAIIAPQYTDGALEMFKNKKNMRVMCLEDPRPFGERVSEGRERGRDSSEFDLRKVSGGLLVQDADRNVLSLKDSPVVTKKKPTAEQLVDLEFAWKVVKHVKSNAIVFAKDGQTLGVGAGQMSRVDSVRLAVNKAVETFKDQKILNGAVMASDAFFPFRDGIDVAAEQGISAVVQPGGSVRDTEVIDACNEHGSAMVVTGERHFRH